MADVTVTITIADVYKLVARRTSVATETDPFYAQNSTEQKQYSQLHGEGDRITGDFLDEAAKEVLKAYVSRQGDAAGVPYEKSATEVIYRFAEGSPVLTQAVALKARLDSNTRDAIVYYIFYMLYKTNGDKAKMVIMHDKFRKVLDELTGDLYRLHD